MVPLSDLAAVSAVPTSISSDGNVIGGRANEAFIWDEAHGMRTVRSLLESQGVNLGGWSLSEVTGLSADGSTIVGNGRDPQGKAEGWIVVIPEPSALGIAAGLLCACYRRCKRRTRANRL